MIAYDLCSFFWLYCLDLSGNPAFAIQDPYNYLDVLLRPRHAEMQSHQVEPEAGLVKEWKGLD